MSDPSIELQNAIVGALKAVGALPAVIGTRVYDDVPTAATFPYISLGDCQVLPDKAECIDGVEVYPQIDVWSQKPGYGETKTITKAVLLALDDRALAVTGFDLVVFEIQSVNYLRDPDGKTRHAALTFHGILTPT
jgi:hypothetical protein